MSDIISYNDVEKRIIEIRGEKVLLDRDVAELYGVETKRVNEAVQRNQDKFPEGYILELSTDECDYLWSQIATANESDDLQSKFLTANISSMSRALPKAFTEKGLYMLATILKSPSATQTTIAIVETFAKLRELSGVIGALPAVEDKTEQKALLRRSGEIIGDILDNEVLEVIGDETSFELDLALVKIKHSIKRGKRKQADGE